MSFRPRNTRQLERRFQFGGITTAGRNAIFLPALTRKISPFS